MTASDNTGIRRVELLDVDRRADGRRRRGLHVGRTTPTALRLQPARAVPDPEPRDRRARPRCRPARAAARARAPTPAATSPTAARTRSTRSRRPTAARSTAPTRPRPARSPVAFDAAAKRTRRTVGYGAQAGIARPAAQQRRRADRRRPGRRCSRATCASGAPAIAAHARSRRDADGRFSYRRAGDAPRGCSSSPGASHVNDTRFAANGYLTLHARARRALTRLHAAPARRRGGSRSAAGCAASSRGGVPVLVQGRALGVAALGDVRRHHASRSGRFSVRYRFRDPASRGGRVRVPRAHPPGHRLPVRDRLLANRRSRRARVR